MRATRNRVYGQPYQGFKSLRLRQESYRTAVFFVEFLRVLWYNCGQRTDAMRPLFLFYPAPRDFLFTKRINKMKQPQFLTKLTTSPPDENNQNKQKANNISSEKNKDQIREESIRKTMAEEGGYIDNPNRIDQPTNSGITQPTLNKYNQRHPEAGFPENVRELTGLQAEQIYTELYYNDRNIGDINNPRIAHAIFDMGVMSNYSNVGRMVQNTINETQGTNLAIDGDIGAQTIRALNNIPENQVDRFMEVLIENRIEYLKGLADWDRYGRGWEARTNRY